ncbi:alpha/beta hydrolase [Roseateles sp.]|uniref:alpha/beta hydrolase n=1 Tax=Roseateles sp. TaxID=1971397 RepID=UPI003D0F9311
MTTEKLLSALLLTLGLIGITQADEPLPQVVVGRVERLANFPSKLVDARHVDVWLPEGYTPAKRYAVLYMHDGQMLFDASTTWNKQAWNVQDTVQRLINEGRIPDTLIVGVWNNGKFRHSEYFPQKYLAGMPVALRDKLIAEGLQNKPQSDNYLRFLVEELKPAIDARYATRPEAASTFLMGSSMGGLISVYAMNEYPQVFGGAAGLSTHWIGGFKPNAAIPLAAFNYVRAKLADPASHRLYQDHGTMELDALYAPYQLVIDDIVREAGYVDGKNFESRVYEGTGHNEKAWAARLATPLLFLMGQR